MVFIRFIDRAGRLVPVDLFLAADDGPPQRPSRFPASPCLDSSILRRAPLGRIEAWVNGPNAVNGALRSGLSKPAPDLRTAIGYFATNPSSKGQDHWAARMIQGEKAPRKRLRSPLRVEVDLPLAAQIAVPTTRPYPDAFYRAVAERYALLASRDRAPVAALAMANGVPLSTAHLWVKKARDKGFLAPGQRGKAG